MNYYRLVELNRQTCAGGKFFLLKGGQQAEEIKAGLTDRHYLGTARQESQLFKVGRGYL